MLYVTESTLVNGSTGKKTSFQNISDKTCQVKQNRIKSLICTLVLSNTESFSGHLWSRMQNKSSVINTWRLKIALVVYVLTLIYVLLMYLYCMYVLGVYHFVQVTSLEEDKQLIKTTCSLIRYTTNYSVKKLPCRWQPESLVSVQNYSVCHFLLCIIGMGHLCKSAHQWVQ